MDQFGHGFTAGRIGLIEAHPIGDCPGTVADIGGDRRRFAARRNGSEDVVVDQFTISVQRLLDLRTNLGAQPQGESALGQQLEIVRLVREVNRVAREDDGL